MKERKVCFGKRAVLIIMLLCLASYCSIASFAADFGKAAGKERSPSETVMEIPEGDKTIMMEIPEQEGNVESTEETDMPPKAEKTEEDCQDPSEETDAGISGGEFSGMGTEAGTENSGNSPAGTGTDNNPGTVVSASEREIKIHKVDSKYMDTGLSGSVYILYEDKDCQKQIAQMPETDENGDSSVKVVLDQDKVYMKERTAPFGYCLDRTVYENSVSDGLTVSVTVYGQEQTGQLDIYRQEEILSDADVSKQRVTFRYRMGSRDGGLYNIYAGEEIKSACGVVEHEKGSLVRAEIEGGTSAAGLRLGTYIVKEIEPPYGAAAIKNEKTVKLSYAGQEKDTASAEVHFTGERWKTSVSVLYMDKETSSPIEGGVFGLFSESFISTESGKDILNVDELIEKAVTGKDGTAVFQADIPADALYCVRHLTPAPGYVGFNESEVFPFYSWEAKETCSNVALTFEGESTVFELFKKSEEDGGLVAGAGLRVADTEGRIIDEWITGHKTHILKGLTVGEDYIFSEIIPAEGYVSEKDILFKVEETSEIQRVVMNSHATQMKFSVQDTVGRQLQGAVMEVLDSSGKSMETWTSARIAHYVDRLPLGEYTLRELSAPEGCSVPEDMKFLVRDTAELQEIVMQHQNMPDYQNRNTQGPGEQTSEQTVSEYSGQEEQEPETRETGIRTASPKTGDDTPLIFWIIAVVTAFGGTICSAVYLLRIRKKR